VTVSKRALNRIAHELERSRPLEPGPFGDAADRTAYQQHLAGWETAVAAVATALHVEMGLDTNGNRRFQWDRFMAAAGRRGGAAR